MTVIIEVLSTQAVNRLSLVLNSHLRGLHNMDEADR